MATSFGCATECRAEPLRSIFPAVRRTPGRHTPRERVLQCYSSRKMHLYQTKPPKSGNGERVGLIFPQIAHPPLSCSETNAWTKEGERFRIVSPGAKRMILPASTTPKKGYGGVKSTETKRRTHSPYSHDWDHYRPNCTHLFLSSPFKTSGRL